MATPTQVMFSYQEVVEALIRQHGIHEGIWILAVEFSFGAANIAASPGGPLAPAAIVPLAKIGIQLSTEINNLSVDAAVVNPAPPKA